MATTRLFLRIWSERAVSRSLRFSLIPNAGTRSTPSLICEPLSRSGASITVVLPLRLDHMGSEGKGRGYCPPARRHLNAIGRIAVSYTHLRAHETKANIVCRLLLEK